MQTEHDGAARFAEGSTAVRRDVLDGKVWSAAPHRVVHDSDTDLVLAHWPGIESLAPTTWIQWLRSGEELGDMVTALRDADPEHKMEVYRNLGLRLTYTPDTQTVRADVDLAAHRWDSVRVRGGT